MHDLQAIIDGLPGIYLIVAADAEYTMVVMVTRKRSSP